MMLLQTAESFLENATLKTLQASKCQYLEDALLELRAHVKMEERVILGLMMAMVALGGKLARHAAVFLEDLTETERSITLGLYQGVLFELYPCKHVCRWLATHYAYVDGDALRLASQLSQSGEENNFMILQISRVCR